ncbi:MAG: mannose-6-phosphate isomerase-like protein (cupin superfamily), partial [Myxococcota bacterium]
MPLPAKLNVHDAFAAIDAPWTPAIAAQVGGSMVKLARLEGSFVWHSHAVEDELFFVLAGRLTMRFRDGEVVLGVG